MSRLGAPRGSADASPVVADETAARAWLENLPLANVAESQRQLLEQLEQLGGLPLPAAGRLAVLEAFREAVHFVQIEQAKRFTNRALPMAAAEAAVFDTTVSLWEQMRRGYQRCVEAALAGDADMRARAGLLCQRVLACAGLKMFHHHRAYRQVPPREWRAMHQAYREAEVLGVAEVGVKDYLNREVQDTSPRIAYVRAVLTALSNPNELSQRQLTFLTFLLERWSGKVALVLQRPDEGDLPPLVADLASSQGPARGAAEGAEVRYLDVTQLAKSLRNRIGLLRKGESPAKLALGEDCVQPSCEQQLVFLYRQWCQARPERSGDRRLVADSVEACQGLAAMHYFISGKAFRPPGERTELNQRERDEIATFGRLATRHEDTYGEAQGFRLERWQLADESLQGMRIVRPAAETGKRYAHGQLIAVKPADAKQFMLAQVRWLMTTESGELVAGVKRLPGLPEAIAVHATGLNAARESWLPALALGSVPALGAPASLLLPAGWFRPGRVIERVAAALERVRLLQTLERGIDFERVTYESIP